ncbi:tyrosine-type recombinase/integrase [Acinetobacter puyangensis]|uniref:tyrosine-type recombinase/integrase n=1 Tax=Acinetobacter puyangensis TaxID=1096779 RepID=UPI003A4D8D37
MAIQKSFTGIHIRNQSIRIDFMYKGIRYRHTLPLEPNKANIKYAYQLRSAAIHALRTGKFNEKELFPHSRPKSQTLNAELQNLSLHYLSLKSVDITPETQARYKTALNECMKVLGIKKNIELLRPTDIQNLRVKLVSQHSVSTVNHYLTILNGFLKWCEDNQYNQGLSKYCKRFTSQSKEPDPLSLEELNQILFKGCLNLIDRAAITLAVYTGLRPGELCGLAFEDINQDQNTITIRRSITQSGTFKIPKTKKERTIFLLPPAQEAIKILMGYALDLPSQNAQVWFNRHQYREDHIHLLLSPKNLSKKTDIHFFYSPNAWNQKWSAIINRANIRYRPPYQTRHTYACWNLTARGNLAFIANQMGHADYSMLIKVYGRWMDSESSNEIELIWRNIQKPECPIFTTSDLQN